MNKIKWIIYGLMLVALVGIVSADGNPYGNVVYGIEAGTGDKPPTIEQEQQVNQAAAGATVGTEAGTGNKPPTEAQSASSPGFSRPASDAIYGVEAGVGDKPMTAAQEAEKQKMIVSVPNIGETPRPVVTSLPNPVITPSAGILSAMAQRDSPSPPIITRTNQQWGVFYFITIPPGANVTINNQTIKAPTPTAVDRNPGAYYINISKEGYVTQSIIERGSDRIMLNDGDRKKYNINLTKINYSEINISTIPEENAKVQTAGSMNFAAVPPQNLERTTDTDKTGPNVSNTWILVSGTCLVIVLVAVFFYMRSKQDNRPFSEQIGEMTKRNPDMSDETIAEKLGCSLKTVQRNRA